jgi:sjoegren syndrome nuclear autoantigen 1
LTRYIENIRQGRDDLHEEITKDEEEKNQIETEIASLTERLTVLTEALVKKYEAQEEFDRTIQETEQAFIKILESSQTLLHVLKKEDSTLNKRKMNVSTRK